MAIVRTLGLAMVAALLSGCFVGSELDNARKLADGPAKPGSADAAKPAAAGAAPKQVASAKPAANAGPSWWQTARTLGSEESKANIVGCKLAKGVEFMERDDCLARGGQTP